MMPTPFRRVARREPLRWAVIAGCLSVAACDGGRSASSGHDASSCPAGSLGGTSYRVSDGDTFKIKDDAGTITTIRLDQIDAPEKRQPWGSRSKQMLYGLLDGKALCVAGKQRDRYGRLIGEIRAGGVIVNREMVRRGGAWAYRRYLKDRTLLDVERDARAGRLGLWSMPEPEPVPPWEFRQAGRTRGGAVATSPPEPVLAASIRNPVCEPKPQCRRMADCSEAMRALAQCGPEGIDGDRDGMPCERLCSPRRAVQRFSSAKF